MMYKSWYSNGMFKKLAVSLGYGFLQSVNFELVFLQNKHNFLNSFRQFRLNENFHHSATPK